MRFVLCLAMGLFALSPWLAAQPARAGDIHSPPKGSALRTSILDAARPLFERETGGAVEFVITTLNVWGPWAYGDVQVQRPGGGAIDWRRTRYGEDYAQGMFDPAHNLFLLREGGDGWTLVEYAVGPTDVAWDWWRQQHNIPAEVFGASSADFPPPSGTRPRSGN